jgi:predicted NBD/HSP70 family sugar kinase
MAYGEYMCGAGNNERNVIFVDVSWGLGMGIINNAKLYYGKSGYAGEFGHMSVLTRNIVSLGKNGCLVNRLTVRIFSQGARGNRKG